MNSVGDGIGASAIVLLVAITLMVLGAAIKAEKRSIEMLSRM